MKTLNIHRTFILTLLLFMAVVSNAQEKYLIVAQEFMENNQLDSAKFYIDKAANNAETANEPFTWVMRGFIYKGLFKAKEFGKNPESPLRIEALNSLRKAIILDEKKEYAQDNIDGAKYLFSTMHNDVVSYLEFHQTEEAIALFRKSQDYFRIISPSQSDIQNREIEFGLALGSTYNEIIDSNKDNDIKAKFRSLAIALFNKVLSMDPNNISANVSLGKLYYNQAVNLVKSTEYDVDLDSLDVVIDQSSKLFKTSLPFMNKAHTLDPKREDALEGLAGIYFGLNEPEKSIHYRKELKKIKEGK
jgi:tetratricopeptide (TPR) repeat protein